MIIDKNSHKKKTKLKSIKSAQTLHCAVGHCQVSLSFLKTSENPSDNNNNVSHGIPNPPAPRDRRRQIRQLQTQIRNLLPRLHRPPSHRLLPFPPHPNLPNPNLLPPSHHLLRRRLRRPLHRPPHRHRRLRLQQHPHAHAPQGDQRLRHFQSHRRSLREGSDLPHHRGFGDERWVRAGDGGASSRGWA